MKDMSKEERPSGPLRQRAASGAWPTLLCSNLLRMSRSVESNRRPQGDPGTERLSPCASISLGTLSTKGFMFIEKTNPGV